MVNSSNVITRCILIPMHLHLQTFSLDLVSLFTINERHSTRQPELLCSCCHAGKQHCPLESELDDIKSAVIQSTLQIEQVRCDMQGEIASVHSNIQTITAETESIRSVVWLNHYEAVSRRLIACWTHSLTPIVYACLHGDLVVTSSSQVECKNFMGIFFYVGAPSFRMENLSVQRW